MRTIGLIQILRLALLASALLLASSAEGAALRLAPSTHLLLGGTPPVVADVEESPIEWNLGDYAAALILGDLGALAGGLIGVGAGVFVFESNMGSINEVAPYVIAVGLSVGAVSVALLTALAVKLYADVMHSPASYGRLVLGAALGLVVAIAMFPVFPVTVFIFPALFAAYAAADFEPLAPRRDLDVARADQPAPSRNPDRGLPPVAIAPVFQARF